MSNEIRILHSATGRSLYAVIQRETDGYVWNVYGGVTNDGAWEEMLAAHWCDPPPGDSDAYNTDLGELTGYFYIGDWPTGIPEVGWYRVTIYEQVGASPAIGDTIVRGEILWWNGTNLLPTPAGATYEALITWNPVGEADEYHLVWVRDGIPVDVTEITSPTLTAYAWPQSASALTLLIDDQACEVDDDDITLRYLATGAERNTQGHALVIIASATIDGATRTWKTPHNRDV